MLSPLAATHVKITCRPTCAYVSNQKNITITKSGGLTCAQHPVAYLGFHFEGVQNFYGKVGVFAWRSHAFVRGVRGHAPPRIFLKMVQFGAF